MATLTRLYYNAGSTGAYSGERALYRAAQEAGLKRTHAQIRTFLDDQELAQRHKPSVKVKQFFPFSVTKRNECHQMDLMMMTGTYRSPTGHKYVLCVVDVGTRLAVCRPLKTKTAAEVAVALASIHRNRPGGVAFVPKKIEADAGGEFKSETAAYLKSKNIAIRLGIPGTHTHQAIIERFQQSLGKKLAKYIAHQAGGDETRLIDWTKALPKLVTGYNNTIHHSLKKSPLKAYRTGSGTTAEVPPSKESHLELRQRVRIVLEGGRSERMTLLRAFDPHWSKKIFTIVRTVTHKDGLRGYYLANATGRRVGRPTLFYRRELRPVSSRERSLTAVAPARAAKRKPPSNPPPKPEKNPPTQARRLKKRPLWLDDFEI